MFFRFLISGERKQIFPAFIQILSIAGGIFDHKSRKIRERVIYKAESYFTCDVYYLLKNFETGK